MSQTIRRVAIAGFTVLVVACGGPLMTPEERTTRSKCGACHKRPGPGSLDQDSWEVLLEDHRKRFKISKEEQQRLRAYLVEAD